MNQVTIALVSNSFRSYSKLTPSMVSLMIIEIMLENSSMENLVISSPVLLIAQLSPSVIPSITKPFNRVQWIIYITVNVK